MRFKQKPLPYQDCLDKGAVPYFQEMIAVYSFWNLRLTFNKFAVKETTFCASCTIFR